MAIPKGDKKIINGWAFYDWANSVYPLVISTAIFPIFYKLVTGGHEGVKTIDFFGVEFVTESLITYVVAVAFLIVSVLSPILSGIADYSGSKKGFMKFFCYMGSISVASLYFFDTNYIEISMIPVITACVGFWGSLVFYNAYLPEIADEDDQDKVSAKGFSMGYIGSSLLLMLCLVPIILDGDTPEKAMMWSRLSFVVVGVWWLAFAQVTYRVLPSNVYGQKPTGKYLSKGFQELKKVSKQVIQSKRLKRYLVAFFLFSMGVQTLMLVAPYFALEEVNGMGDTDLIICILIIQFLGAAGAFLFSRSSKKWGNLPVLRVVMVLWVGVCVGAYYTEEASQFYVVAFFVGLVMGGTQALARSTYSKFLPETEDHASFFSFYDVLEKIGIVIGMLSLATVIQISGSNRAVVPWLAAFFILGAIALMFVPKKDKSL